MSIPTSRPVRVVDCSEEFTPEPVFNFQIKEWKGSPVYGVTWNKTSTVTLTRTNASVGKVAAAGEGAGTVTNDFDSASIYSEFEDYTDANGNEFVKIPAFWILETDEANFKSWQICKKKMPGSYKPWCFYDFTNNVWLDHVYVGKYPAGQTLTGGTKLTSLPNEYPLINKNIVEFRSYAVANGAGYQQLDIHVMDMLQTLFIIEFATLHSQSIMQGWTNGRYADTDRAVVAESSANRIIVTNAVAANYAVGQPIGIGSSLGGNQRFYGRDITAITTYDDDNKAIEFGGTPVNISVDDRIYHVGWKSGFSAGIAASSGSLINNSDRKSPFHYRGIENLYGNIYQFVDGVNINDRQAWVCRDAASYQSNLFAHPYEKLSYVNASTSGYVKYMGFDKSKPFAKFPVDVSSNFYQDYYYQLDNQRIAVFGGHWINGGHAGLFYWYLYGYSGAAGVSFGGRLVKKGV